MKTRYDQIRLMEPEAMATFLCEFLQAFLYTVEEGTNNELNTCAFCPATKFCNYGHAGFLDWLQEEQEIRL